MIKVETHDNNRSVSFGKDKSMSIDLTDEKDPEFIAYIEGLKYPPEVPFDWALEHHRDMFPPELKICE